MNFLRKSWSFRVRVEQLVWSIWLSVSLYFIWRSHIDQRGLYDILGNNFGFFSPGAPSPATLKVCPNSNSSLLGLSIHMSHSWLNVHLDLTRRRFLRTSSSGIRSRGSLGVFQSCICANGGDWGFSWNGFLNISICICVVHTRCNTPPVYWRSLRLLVLWHCAAVWVKVGKVQF